MNPSSPGWVDAWIGLGANLGDTSATLGLALRAMALLPDSGPMVVSSYYVSDPWQADGPEYLNAVARLPTGLSAPALLDSLQVIEQQHGRRRDYPNAPRTLDLDLLMHGSTTMDTRTLTLPHPRMHQRAFVLKPMAELDPTLLIPGHGDIATLLKACAGQRCERLAGQTPPKF